MITPATRAIASEFVNTVEALPNDQYLYIQKVLNLTWPLCFLVSRNLIDDCTDEALPYLEDAMENLKGLIALDPRLA